MSKNVWKCIKMCKNVKKKKKNNIQSLLVEIWFQTSIYKESTIMFIIFRDFLIVEQMSIHFSCTFLS